MAGKGFLRSIAVAASLALVTFASSTIPSTANNYDTAADETVIVIDLADWHAPFLEAVLPEAPVVTRRQSSADVLAPKPERLPTVVDKMVCDAEIRVAWDTYRRQRGIG
jgi:hypothetical protein